MPMRKKPVKQKITVTDLHLGDINGMNAGIKRMIGALVGQIGDLSATDAEQLRDLAALQARIEVTERMTAMAEQAADPVQWHKMASLLDKQTGQKRMILRDLKVTRQSVPTSNTGKRDQKAQGKSGADWEGVL